MSPTGFATFAAATLALNLTPGPDMLYVLARSLGEGRRAGIVSALGISAGCLVHMTLVSVGLAGVLASAPLAYDTVRLLGAAYLCYLGFRALLQPPARRFMSGADGTGLWRLFLQGAITNILNPKVALFFLAFLPQFVTPGSSAPAAQLLLLGIWFNLSGTAVNLLVALTAARLAPWLERGTGAAWLSRLTGAVFLGLAVRLAASRR